VFYTSTTFAHDHPDVVAKFVRASVRGWRDYMKDPAEANAMILKLNPALNKDWMEYSYGALRDGHFVMGDDASGAATGQFDAARWQMLYEQLVELHVVKKPIDVSSAYTTQFLK
jgi:NitT/TauT family transport system substrate-binding protein